MLAFALHIFKELKGLKERNKYISTLLNNIASNILPGAPINNKEGLPHHPMDSMEEFNKMEELLNDYMMKIKLANLKIVCDCLYDWYSDRYNLLLLNRYLFLACLGVKIVAQQLEI